MTTWPPRMESAIMAMEALTTQKHDSRVHFVLALSKDEFDKSSPIVAHMRRLGVEVIWDNGNIRSHKKLMPALARYSENPILVVDDDVLQQQGWLQAFIDDHRQHPDDIIYGMSTSRVEIIGDCILERISRRDLYLSPGKVTFDKKPANGAAGTLYPAGTFTDERFFDRSAFMNICPTSDETWQWAWSVMEGRTHRCLSSHNMPDIMASNQEFALSKVNLTMYTTYHNRIAEAFPLYKEKLKERIEQEL